MKKTIMNAVFVLSFFSILDRALGFFFKIYLSRELGAEALGAYQVALSLFFVLLTVTTSGIPLVVSKLTAKYRQDKNLRAEQSLANAALILGLIFSLTICLVVILLKRPLASLFADSRSVTVLLFLLPSIVFSSIYSAFRGNLWGRERYFAVSLVEVVEQIVRIAACIAFFMLGYDKLYFTALSLSIGCFVSAAVCAIYYFSIKGRLKSPRGQFIPLLKSSTPITVSRGASSLINSLIAIVVPFLLITSGYNNSQAMELFGSSIGMAMPLLYIPITVIGSLAFVLIPTVSASMTSGNYKSVNQQIEKAISFSIVFSAIFIPVFLSLGKPIGLFIYDNADAGNFIAASGWLMLPVALENITSSIMNSLDLEMRSFANCMIGSGVMFAFLFAFYGHFNIMLLSIGLGLSWTTATILHIIAICKKTGLKLNFIPKLIKSVIIIIPSHFVTLWLFNLMTNLHILLAILIAALVGIVFFICTATVFSLIEIDIFRSKRKKPSKSVAKNRKLLYNK